MADMDMEIHDKMMELQSIWSHVIPASELPQPPAKRQRPVQRTAQNIEAALKRFALRTSTSYLKLQDVDYVSGLALRIASSVVGGKQKSAGGWLGKCLDLSKAYKQMGVLPEHRYLSVIFFHDVAGKPRFYISNSLMFGATAMVHSFNRVSRSLWFLMNRMLLIPCGVFYDGFPMFSPEELATNADEAASEFLDLLGWKHARTGLGKVELGFQAIVNGSQFAFSPLNQHKSSLVLMEVGAWSISRLSPGQDIFNFMGGSLAQSVQDALGIKATSTLHARANPLIRYAAFLKGMGVPAFPVREEAVYMFLKSNPQLAPTFPKSLMTSIAFAKYVLGLTGCDEALSSGRVRGVVAVHFTNKRKLTQRPPLTVDQIRSLEFTVIDKNRSAMDRIAAGFFLLLIFGRLRFSDAQSISEMHLDKVPGSDHGYLECGAERCKTSLTMEKKVRLLPVVVPTMSFSVDGWVEDWMDLRKQQKMELGAGKPLLPTPTVEGTWGKVPLSCEAAGDWLRGLVKEKPGGKVRIATHSCKSSILSMAAKFGLEPSTRRYLGYHSSGRDRSMLIYSRDAMAHPVREMERMIEAINENRFDPDATRSGYFMGAPVPVESKDCESSSSSGSSQDEEELNHTDDETAVNKVVGDWGHQAVGGEQQTFYRHKTSRCLHATCDEGSNHFTCGRSISTRYARETEKPKFLHPLCSKCFKV